MSNEIMKSNQKDNYVVTQNEEGKFIRKATYEAYSSITPVTRQEKINFLNLIEGSNEDTNGLKDHKGKHIVVANVIFRPYDKINEETGEMEYGVLTYLLTPENVAYVTSSKSVYFSMKRIFEVFGSPSDEGWEDITLQVIEKKGLQHKFIDVKMLG